MSFTPNPDWDCQDCGACCATYRVSFYWAEADDGPGGTVPVGMTEQVSPALRCMVGTGVKPPRCVALDGQIGQRVSCTIHPLRSSTCKELQMGDEKCRKARALHGLPH